MNVDECDSVIIGILCTCGNVLPKRILLMILPTQTAIGGERQRGLWEDSRNEMR